ncbi:60S ribosomal protein L24 [Knufia peltigerae]|uniref:60S ribosomal protein L24 n=1 Tax=Knufia peltigerae TaxID=1002370 RepID=A0AA38Y863_9EURO|nr:60S ribosomal protein L24 [Knufia peltigerae]
MDLAIEPHCERDCGINSNPNNHQPPPHKRPPGTAFQSAKMRTYDDTFSATKIYPGKGKLYVRGDSKVFRFQNGKTESLFLQRKNPRRIAWTMLYRRMHKKGISEPQMEPVARLNLGGKRDGSEQTLEVVTEVAKKRSRRTVKHQRAIVGASLDVIKERRSQRPEARAAARQAAIKESKEQKAAAESKKKAEKAKSAAKAATGQVRGGIASKQQAKGKPTKVQATSR